MVLSISFLFCFIKIRYYRSKDIKNKGNNNFKKQETYKEWLSFTNEAQIRNSLAHFYGPDKFVMNSGDLPEDLIVIADLIGDGEQLCFSKITRNFVWVDHGELEIIDDFGAVLSEIIRMLKPKSCLSPEMKESLMNMVKNNSQNKKRNNDKERNNRCF